MNLKQAKEYLSGPIASVRTPFDKDGDIDYTSLRQVIEQIISGGSKTVMLTCGDSHFDCLSDDEILELTQVTVQQTAGRAMVIASDRYHSTRRAIDFATKCRERGADMYMALPPDWGWSCTPETLAEHYAAVAEVMPLMIVTNRFIQHGAEFGIKTLQRSLDASDKIVAIKDDMVGNFAQDICMKFSERCAIIAGGQKRNHLLMHPYGCDGYLSTFSTYNPSIAQHYWKAIQENDLSTASTIIVKQDAAFFEYIQKVEGGFDAAMHGMLELYELGQRYRRKPYYSISDEDLEKLQQFLCSKHLLT